MRQRVNNAGGQPWRGDLAGVLARGAEPEHLQQVTLDAEPGIAAEVADELVDRAGREGDRHAAVGADEMVTVSGHAGDVGRMAVGAEDATQDVDGGEELERPVDRGAADLGDPFPQVRHHLLGGEGAGAGEDVGDDRTAGGGRAVAVASEQVGHALGRGEGGSGEGGSVRHIQSVA